MGLGSFFLVDLIDLKRGGFLTGANKVIEIGAQQLADSFLTSDSLLDEVFALFGRSRPDLGKPHGSFSMAEDAPSSRRFWTALGFDYAALDFDGHRDSIAIDLNRDSVPTQFVGAFDLVVNTGTTEHVANQDNTFRVIHDLTRKGGVAYHEVPATMTDHGLFNYNPRFFWKLRDANDYEVLSMKVFTSGEEPVPPHIQENNERFGGGLSIGVSHLTSMSIRVSFRKRNRRPFGSPMDLPDAMMPGRLKKLATAAKRAIPWR
jgi:hypothetical protein